MTKDNLEISVAFAPALDTPDHIAMAEELGYARAWCFDGVAIWADIWMTLARAADKTKRIGLGTGVLVPSYRHVMTTAAAVATLAGQAPGRVVVGVGVGHGNRMLGGKATSWKQTANYVSALRSLFRGEEVRLDGALAKMLQNESFVAKRPLDVPILFSAQGPKGIEIAKKFGDGVIAAMMPNPGFTWSSVLLMGTVLPEDGTIDNDHLMEAAGPGAAVAYHNFYDLTWPEGQGFSQLPNASLWAEELEKTAPERRHLAAWAKHLVGLTEEDKKALTPEMVRQMTFTGTADELRNRLQALMEAGATEVIYQPTGSDIPGELQRFAEMAGI